MRARERNACTVLALLLAFGLPAAAPAAELPVTTLDDIDWSITAP